MNSFVINPEKETQRITDFIKNTTKKTGFKKLVVGISGGVDSATVLTLCVKALGAENIIAVSMPYGKPQTVEKESVIKLIGPLGLPKENIIDIDIKSIVEVFKIRNPNIEIPTHAGRRNNLDKIRIGNMIARVRMIVLYDLAKQFKALVCGTENKSEYLLGYFTRFGDEASDLEPLRHLYKTQVYKIANYLGIPKEIIRKKPTAGLWDGQTDQEELGFTYQEADEILFQVFEKKIAWEKTKNQIYPPKADPPRAEKIINKDQRQKDLDFIEKVKTRVLRNWFKKEAPYFIG